MCQYISINFKEEKGPILLQRIKRDAGKPLLQRIPPEAEQDTSQDHTYYGYSSHLTVVSFGNLLKSGIQGDDNHLYIGRDHVLP